MHSSHGIQIVHLLTENLQTKSWQAQGPSLHLQSAQQTAAPETNITAMMAETANIQQPVHAHSASRQLGRQSAMASVQCTDVHQNLHADIEGPSRANVPESEAAANSMPSMSAASQAQPTHSVWSMSASSEASSSNTGVSEPSPGSPDSNSFITQAALPDAIASPVEHGVGSDTVSLFTVCLGGARSLPEPGDHCGVIARMETPAFDPEKFVMDHIPGSVLQHHRLTDYAVELLGDGTSTECQHQNCCRTFQEQQATQHCASYKSVLLLVVAILKPRLVAINPTGCVKCTVLTVSVHVPSGTSVPCLCLCELAHGIVQLLPA